MKLYKLYKKQELNISFDVAWEFFSSPQNLKIITPPYMGFEIIGDSSSDKMFPGMIIEYIVRPVMGLPMRWVTEITHVKDKEYFIDEQRFGPYSLWHHLHRFRVENGKLIMEDLINYALPFGFLGMIAHRLFVRKKVEEIFEYRVKIIEELFDKKKTA